MSQNTDAKEIQIANRKFDPAEIDAARELFFELGPAKCSEIVRRMRDKGWKWFRLVDLAGRESKGLVGLIQACGWAEEWKDKYQASEVPESESLEESESVDPESRGCGDEIAPDEAKPVEAVQRRPKAAELPPIERKPGDTEFQTWLRNRRREFVWDWRYQRVVFRLLERLTRKKVTRAIVAMPPRHGKSEMVTIHWAAWLLERDPRMRIVIASHNQKLANKFSRRIKAVYLGRPVSEAEEELRRLATNQMDEWETLAGGGVKAVGVGAGITGYGADVIIVDDPVKSRAEAESENYRERTWDWFTNDMTTRLEPKGIVVLIQTRWHEDDLAGRLIGRQAKRVTSDELKVTSQGEVQGSEFGVQGSELKSKRRKAEADVWEVLSLPALAEEDDPLGRKVGEALCPQRYDREALLRRKAELPANDFAALYQQSPVPDEGGLFRREWFRIVDRAPDGLRWYRAYDLAVSTRTSADFSASARVALDRDGTLYIDDVWRARVEYPEQRRYIAGRITAERGTTVEHGIELALHGQAFVQELLREEKFASTAIRGVRVAADKYTRALAWSARAAQGKVALVRGPWNEAFLEEVCRFPHTKHDDQVDAVSLAVQMLESRKGDAWGF